jgi:hypothetical protein
MTRPGWARSRPGVERRGAAAREATWSAPFACLPVSHGVFSTAADGAGRRTQLSEGRPAPVRVTEFEVRGEVTASEFIVSFSGGEARFPLAKRTHDGIRFERPKMVIGEPLGIYGPRSE